MSKAAITKARLHQSDKFRAILTDTAPYEVPIIFSNDGFYKNLVRYNTQSMSSQLSKLVDTLIFEPRQYTVPLRYNIVKDAESIRTLSLVHPHGQVQIAEFYGKYDQLICEYAGRSPYSIRYPKRVGTMFFFKCVLADKNKYKNSGVDTIDVDKLVRNPASYFSYAGFDRLYRFFLSDDHVRLEKKFNYLLSLDVSKCFDSVYTHSIAWAVKNKTLAKDNRFASAFGNRFDKLMQQLNHGETSGICIGPEASRVFAEIILAKVDQTVFDRLFELKIYSRSHYECRRYVDDYYVFAESEEVLASVQHEISTALREYKLHLNNQKSERLTRPFYTKKSLVVDRVNQSIQQLWEKTFANESHQGSRCQIPIRIYKHRSLFGNFTREVKAACYSSGLGYDAIANYVVGAMKRKLLELVDNYEEFRSVKVSGFNPLHYRQLMLFMLDVGFYFFTLYPTVASSLRLSHMIVLVAHHLKRHDAEGFDIVREHTLRCASLLVRSSTFSALFRRPAVVPIELLNVVVSLQPFSNDGSLESDLLERVRLEKSDDRYFQTIVQLFIYRQHPGLKKKREAVFLSACKRLKSATGITQQSEHTHLLMDLLSCPFVPLDERAILLVEIWPKLRQEQPRIGAITRKGAGQLVTEIEKQHWFVQWQGIDLLNIIEKKELSTVYA